MMKPVQVMVEDVYVPVKFRDTLDAAKVEALAESIIDQGLLTPISVRADKQRPDRQRPDRQRPDRQRYVLVTGLHRLEATRLLGEREIAAYVVSARQH